MTFNSNVPVGVIAVHGRYITQRGYELITTLPVADLSKPASTDPLFFPHYADGGGWTTEITLINTTDATSSGTVQFLGPGGATMQYSIYPSGMWAFKTSGAGSAATVGAIRVTPNAGTVSPSGLAIFSFTNNDGIMVSEAGVPALPPAQAFRMYAVEGGSYRGQLQTGIAIANPSSVDTATVTLELTNSAGNSTGMTSTLTVPPLGHRAAFLTQFPGFESTPFPFKGMLRIATTSPAGVAVIGVRGRYNERNEFLVTTSLPVDEAATASSAEALFPHLADGGGYTTEFVLFSGSAGQASSGMLRFFTQSGAPWN